MKIAIIGAGFCGLALAWHLNNTGKNEIVLFDSVGIGKGASGIAAGLLHPYAGAHAKKNFRADEGMEATHKLLKEAENAVKSPVIVSKGLVRLAITEQQKEDFAKTAALNDDVIWLTPEECSTKLGFSQHHAGIYISSAVVVNCEKYMQGLWLACADSGAAFCKRKINSLEELKTFDKIMIASGAETNRFVETSALKITPVKGQILEIKHPAEHSNLLCAIASQGYIIQEGENLIAGSTYEKNFAKAEPDIDVAKREILPKMQLCLPELKHPLVTGCRAGVRASTPDHLPIIKQVDEKTWVLTGMGSKGLLYHALYAGLLKEAGHFC